MYFERVNVASESQSCFGAIACTVKCSNNLEQLCHLCSTLVDCPLLLLIVYLSVFKFWLLTVIVRTQNLLSGPIQLDISRMFLILFLSILLSHYLCHALYPVTRTQQVTIWNTWNKLWLVFQKKSFSIVSITVFHSKAPAGDHCHCSKRNLNSTWTKGTLDCFCQTFTWFVHSQNSCLLSNSWNLQIACSQNWTVAAQVHLLSFLLFWYVYRKLIRDQFPVYYGTWRFILCFVTKLNLELANYYLLKLLSFDF
jgi:hypothetical protein